MSSSITASLKVCLKWKMLTYLIPTSQESEAGESEVGGNLGSWDTCVKREKKRMKGRKKGKKVAKKQRKSLQATELHHTHLLYNIAVSDFFSWMILAWRFKVYIQWHDALHLYDKVIAVVDSKSWHH